MLEASYELVNVSLGVVKRETNPGACRETETLVKRRGALESGSDTDVLVAQELGHIVWVDTLERERNDATFATDLLGTEDGERITKALLKYLYGVGDELLLMVMDDIKADRTDEIKGCAETDGAGDVGGPCFKAGWDVFVEGIRGTRVEDHATTENNGSEGFEERVFAIEDTGTSRAKELVSRKGDHVSIPFLDREGQVADELGSVNYDSCLESERPYRGDDIAHWIDDAQDIGDSGEGDDTSTSIYEVGKFLEPEEASFINGEDAEFSAATFGELFPGEKVGVVFERRDDDVVTRFDLRSQEL